MIGTWSKREARHFADVVDQVGGAKALDLPAVMDYENNPGKLSKTLITVALAFLIKLERITGRKPIIYTGNAFAANFNASLGGYPLWIARYSETRVPSDTVTWKRWDIWQYSDSGKVSGIKGNVDLNEFDGTTDELRKSIWRYCPWTRDRIRTSGTFRVNGKEAGESPSIWLQNLCTAAVFGKCLGRVLSLGQYQQGSLFKWVQAANCPTCRGYSVCATQTNC
ncbi:hypothetical protein JOD82_000360 [Paenibacillus sp. 1182]|nr:hypothetical protein [Paenibacillus sp. 1182]